MTTTFDVFISSRMNAELQAERALLRELLPTLNYGEISLHAWEYEHDQPASDPGRVDGKPGFQVEFEKRLQNSALYLGLFADTYGEYTIREFEKAGEIGMPRLVFVRNIDSATREPKLKAFLDQHAGERGGLAIRNFTTLDELRQGVTDSIHNWLVESLRGRTGAISADLYERASRVQERPRKLIGRDALLTEVRAMLDSGDQVLLRGFAGMGKTALAAELAARWLEDKRGPVMWLKAGAAGAGALFEALARGFGADAAGAVARLPGEDARAKLVGDLLEDGGVKLVVLDDCWSAPALHRVLQAIPRGIPALVTARQRYAVERLREVGRLARPDSLALFRYHSDSPSPAPSSARMERGLGGEVLASDAAATAQPTWDESANALCDRLGDHAFAVEIAGKTCKARRLTPAELLAQIKDAPHTLSAPLDYAARDRSNISALIEASLNVLDEGARNVFLAFGAFFAPRLTPEMLMRFLNGVPEVSDAMLARVRRDNPQLPLDTTDDILRQLIVNTLAKQPVNTTSLNTPLTQLHDQGLIERVPAVPDVNVEYYSLHDLAYAYAAGQINPASRQRALDACLAYMNRYDSPSLPNFAALRPELDGLLAAADWALSNGREADVETFAWKLSGGSEILNYQGYYTLDIRLLQAVRASAQVRTDRAAEGRALNQLGIAYKNLGRYDEAISHHQLALVIDREIGNRLGEAQALGNLGNAYKNLGRYDEAISQYEQILPIFRQIGNRQGEASTLGNLGVAYKNLGRYDEAISHHQLALVIDREIGNRQGEASTLGNLGVAYKNLGRYDEAISHHEQYLDIARQIGDRRGEANALGNLGVAYKNLGRYAKAIEHYQGQLTIARQIGDRLGEGNALNNLGSIFAEQGQYAQAIQHFEAARVIYAELGVPGLAMAERNLARVQAKLAGGS